MRALILPIALLLLAAPAATANCHFCTEEIKEQCGTLQTGPCADAVSYAANHYPGHARDEACAELEDQGIECP